MKAKAIRHTLIQKGYIKPNSVKVDQQPGKVIAVRRVDDRPVTRMVKVSYAPAH